MLISNINIKLYISILLLWIGCSSYSFAVTNSAANQSAAASSANNALFSDSHHLSGFTPFVQLLNWQASEQSASVWANDITFLTGPVDVAGANVSFGSSVGLRGGLIYAAEDHFWDSKLYWTYFPTSTSASYATTLQIIIPEFFSGFLSNDKFFGANIHWQIIMNTLDYELSHAFNLVPSLSFTPSVGLKAATINQTINSNWISLFFVSTEKVNSDFFGAGPTLGLDGKWNFYDTFDLLGHFSVAYMWGRWNNTDTYSRPAAFLTTPTTITSKMSNSQLGTNMFDYFVGLQWTHIGKPQITLQAGYEMQYWTNQLRVLTFQQVPMHGDLTTQGETCGIYIDL